MFVWMMRWEREQALFVPCAMSLLDPLGRPRRELVGVRLRLGLQVRKPCFGAGPALGVQGMEATVDGQRGLGRGLGLPGYLLGLGRGHWEPRALTPRDQGDFPTSKGLGRGHCQWGQWT